MVHTISPTFNSDSHILILGSFPSILSSKSGYFYGNPYNRFWRVLAYLYDSVVPCTNEEKQKFILDRNIALWDVIQSCSITGSSDSSIKNVHTNDISIILNCAKITKVFTNGKKASLLYKKYLFPLSGIEDICLPSTSPANASWSFERLCKDWRIILE